MEAPSQPAAERPYIGGQAVIEGVMMRAPGCIAVAVRRPGGAIAVREGPLRSRLATSRFWKVPALRGIAALAEAMTLGFSALRFSAEQQMDDKERASAGKGSGTLVLAISVVAAILIFKGLPQLLARGLGWIAGLDLAVQDPIFHAIMGAFQLLILVGYLLAIGRIPEIRRVFAYHGAEHKTISAYEADLPLTVENVRCQSTLHPRCGTTFLVIVVVIAIVLGSVATPVLLPNAHGFSGQVMTFALRLGLLPLVAAVSYEVQRMSARYCTRGPLRALLWPGFLFQRVTTREPDDAQIEIAIAAMRAAMWRHGAGRALPAPADDAPLVFESFAAFLEVAPSLRPRSSLSAAA